MEIIRAQEQSRDLHESFHNQLERAQDGFSVVADYFGRGVFNKVPQTCGENKLEMQSNLPVACMHLLFISYKFVKGFFPDNFFITCSGLAQA